MIYQVQKVAKNGAEIETEIRVYSAKTFKKCKK